MSRNSAKQTVDQYKEWLSWYYPRFKRRHGKHMTIEKYRNKDF